MTEPFLPSSLAADLALTINNNTYNASTGGYQYVDSSLTLTGSGDVTGAKVYFGSDFVVGNDYLTCTSVGNIYGSYNSSTGIMTVSGTDSIANYQTFLRNVRYYSSNATSGTKTIYMSVSQGSTSTYYYSGTGHFYEYVAATNIDWGVAASAANNRSISANGTTYTGYLATITSSGENSFVAEKCAGDGWIGASDSASEGVWRWMTGPEAGTQFWQGNYNGYVVSSRYNNWANGEPNDSYSTVGEDHAHMYASNGTWNDYYETYDNIAGYLVEYGTSYINLTSSSVGSCTITIVTKPSNVSLSVLPASTTSMNLYWSATNASSCTVYKDGDALLSGTTATSYTNNGLGVNTQHYYSVSATNSAGTTYTSNVYKYTLAAVPSISAVNQTPDTTKNDLTINPNGNPAGTTYIIQYSTDNVNWSNLKTLTATTYTDPGLAADTTYYYRVCALNGDNVASSYSSPVSAKTNDSPEISSLSPELDIYRSEVTGYTTITLSGTVTDHDNDTVTLSATANGVEKTTEVSSTTSGAAWSLSWDVLTDSFDEATYTGIVITANDGTGKSNAASSATWTDTLYVDKTPPGAPAITHDTAWTNASSVTVTMTNGTDTGDVVTGADHTEYRYRTVDADTGSVISDWTNWATYEGAFNITAAGITTLEAVTVDRAGNRSEVTTSIVRIDRTNPEGGSFTLKATYEDEYDNETYTRNQTVNLKNISGSESGGDPSETEPTYMEVSNSSDFTVSSGWVPYSSEYNGWALTAGDGEKTVYIRFKDSVGNVSAAITDTIIFDSTSPVIAISAPSRYAAKCGLSVSYTLTIDDGTATLYGINAGDTSYVALNATGTVENVLAEMPGWISIENTDATHREVTITLPADLVEEGTIAIMVSRAAAIDPAGNESVTVPGNFSFNVDSTPPTHQNELFTDDLTIAGGGAVTLAAASADCVGGQDGDSVRFAPVGYDGEDPANGETITSTHGRSSDIIAPTEEGTYKLYIIDEAGNISEASEATLTVKNLGPSITVEGPSDDYVQAADSVEYIVTYSDDTQEITLSQMDVTLATTGTANAYVEVSEIDGEPLQRKITLYNLMGEGTVAIRIAMGSAIRIT